MTQDEKLRNEPCQYCGKSDCDYDCDESQADGFDSDNKLVFNIENDANKGAK